MVYMAADKNDELDAVAVRDLREMESGANDNDNAHVVVQINRAWPDSFQRYEIRPSEKEHGRKHGVLVEADDDATNMGAQKTLEDFLKWAADMFPAEHYFLVLWGHAYGLGFGRDHGDKLTLKEIQGALDKFKSKRNESGQQYNSQSDGRLELLGANACAMSYIEAAWELRASAQYLVASQISVPFAGWPYESILRQVGNLGPKELGQLVLDLYVSHYNSQIRGERVAMSLLDLQKLQPPSPEMPTLKDLIGRFADEIRNEAFGNMGAKGRGPVRDIFIGAAAGDVRPLVDFHDLCEDFGDTQSSELKKIAEGIQACLDTVIIDHDQHPDLADLNGIGIFAPFVTDEADLKRLQLLEPDENASQSGNGSKDFKLATGQKEYESLSLFEGLTQSWPRLVYDDLREEISPELTDSIVGIDAPNRIDRSDVTQIILGIDSAFNKLDRVLSAARTHVDDCLRPNSTKKRKAGKPADANGHVGKFGLPWLKLIQPVDLETQLQGLRQRAELKKLRNGNGAAKPKAPAPLADGDPALVTSVVDFFMKVESAIGEVERATRRGLTHPTLGLGPSSPGRLGPDIPPKQGHGPDIPPKQGHGPDIPPKQGHGPDIPPKQGHGEASFEPSLNGTSNGDLRVDLALARVHELFQQVGQALKGLEQVTQEVETTARTVLAGAEAEGLTKEEMMGAAAEEIVRSFRILEDASANSRRTVRRVLGHPLYGLGPGSIGIGLEERQALAVSGGLDRRNLRLL